MRRDRATSCAAIIGTIIGILAASLLAGCTGPTQAGRSLQFDAHSHKAILVIGTSANSGQTYSDAGDSLSTFWQQYDPLAWRLVEKGSVIRTKVFRGPYIPFVGGDRGYLDPTITVLEVDPGDYALTAAGFPNVMTLFVPSIDSRSRADTYVVDPLKFIDPAAKVDPRQNFVFSVAAGEIAYIGHFEFVKPRYFDKIVSINYTRDPAAAREALKAYPGIKGALTVLDLAQPTESASLYP